VIRFVSSVIRYVGLSSFTLVLTVFLYVLRAFSLFLYLFVSLCVLYFVRYFFFALVRFM